MASAGQPLIQVENIGRSFDGGAVVALNGVSLSVEHGEFVAVVGRSGSGKSSLLNMMAGIDTPDSGIVRWKGEAIARRQRWTALRRAGIGLIFQEFLLLPTLTAAENVAIAIQGSGVSSKAAMARAEELLGSVGLSQRLHHLPHALSGGERQRVAIARSLANKPELLLCDEPTGNLDSANARAVVDLLLSLRRDGKTALVLVTHDDGLASLAERRVRMRDGRLVEAEQTEAGA